MIPSPNLDDRTYNEIVEEAIRLIPHYCPEWTNHNPTDPGITLIELFAWMTEMVIYRLNRVPEKTYLTLLDLVGLSFNPPQSARALLTFYPVDGYSGEINIKRGTQASTTKSDAVDSIVFETEKELIIKNINLESCFSTHHGLVTNNLIIDEEERKKNGFPLFSGENEIERFLYIADPVLSFLVDNNNLSVTFHAANAIQSMEDEIVNFLEWQYWNGSKWLPLEAHRTLPGVMRKDNEVHFCGPLDLAEAELEDQTGFFIRAALVNYPDKQSCFEINEISINLRFHGEGLNPDLGICNTENMVFHIIDMNKDFRPFVEIPKYNDSFYLASDEVFSKEDADMQIIFYLSDENEPDKPEANKDLILKYEYWNGKNWLNLGSTTVDGVNQPQGKFNFTDSTNAFLQNGMVKFRRPADMQKNTINGQEHYWVRVRIGAGDFGKGGQHKQTEDGKWIWVYERPVKPPILSRIRLSFVAAKQIPAQVIIYNNFKYIDFSRNNYDNFQIAASQKKDKKLFNLFEIKKEQCPITYLGFNAKFTSGDTGIYFKINERKKIQPARGLIPRFNKIGIDDKRSPRAITLKWEYWNGKSWRKLSVNDYTDNFHESGFIEFKCPADLDLKSEFGKEQYWLRLIFESGSFEIPPRIQDVLLNSVYGYNQQTFENEILGSSNGSPGQMFDIFRKPVLPGMELIIKESCLPPAKERELIINEEGKDAIVEIPDNGGKPETWIRYHEVENFYISQPISRHYCVDYINNKIIFGDGSRGIIPPKMKNNIRIKRYVTGGGTTGNVGSNTITILRQNIPYVAAVTNHYPAAGGCDIENIEDLKNRAANVFKNLNRAVTIGDFEWLAMEASTSVARAKCLSRCGTGGEVIVVIVPKPDSDDFDMKEKLLPSSELLRRVKEFLNARKLVGTRIRIESPVYKNITINLKIVFKKEVSQVQILKEQIESYIRRVLHPITGGRKGAGWGFGMPLAKNEIFNILDKIDGIYYIEEIDLHDNDIDSPVEKITLDEDSLIFLDRVNIDDRKYVF